MAHHVTSRLIKIYSLCKLSAIFVFGAESGKQTSNIIFSECFFVPGTFRAISDLRIDFSEWFFVPGTLSVNQTSGYWFFWMIFRPWHFESVTQTLDMIFSEWTIIVNRFKEWPHHDCKIWVWFMIQNVLHSLFWYPNLPGWRRGEVFYVVRIWFYWLTALYCCNDRLIPEHLCSIFPCIWMIFSHQDG